MTWSAAPTARRSSSRSSSSAEPVAGSGILGPCGWRRSASTGSRAESFAAALRGAGVGLVVDVRQRRGVRGSEYSWANSQRLQALLAEAGIDYLHRKELAPTTELRQLQYAEDERRGVGKRSRVELAPEYARRYVAEILDAADLDEFASQPAARHGHGAALRRARPRGLPSVADRRPARPPIRGPDRAPAPDRAVRLRADEASPSRTDSRKATRSGSRTATASTIPGSSSATTRAPAGSGAGRAPTSPIPRPIRPRSSRSSGSRRGTNSRAGCAAAIAPPPSCSRSASPPAAATTRRPRRGGHSGPPGRARPQEAR